MELHNGVEAIGTSYQPRQVVPEPASDGEFDDSATPKKGLNFRPYLRTIKRRSIIIASVTFAVGVLGFIIGDPGPPIYAGGFRVLVEPVSTEAKLTDPTVVARGGPQTNAELDYATQLEILKSPKILSEISEQVKTKFPDFNSSSLREGLEVKRVDENGQTKILQVTYQGYSPDLVQHVLEVVSSKYLKYSLEERKSRLGEGVKFIEDQLPSLQARVSGLQQQLRQLQQQYQMIDPAAQGGNLLSRLNETTVQQQDTQRQLIEQQTLFNSLTSQLRFSPQEAVVAAAISQNPTYQGIITKIAAVDTQIAVDSTRFQPDSPNIQALQEQKQTLLALLQNEARAIAGESLTGVLSNPQVTAYQDSVRLGLIQQLVAATTQIQLLEARSQDIAKTKRELEARLREFPEIAGRYTEIQRQLEIATRTLDQLLVQRETLRVEAAQSQVPWELISKPGIPRDVNGNPVAESPDRKKQLLGVIAGLMLGVGAAILWEMYRDIFYSVEDVEDGLPFPLLGSIPFYQHLLSSSDPVDLSKVDDDLEAASNTASFLNAFDTLYGNLKLLFFNPPRSVAICSASSGDGKSTVALHLAQAAASMGQRVLLVDANMRLPDIHDRLNISNAKGLSDFLVDQVEPSYLIQQSPVAENLYVMPSGRAIPGSAKLLASAQMQTLRKRLEEQFDLVIYDTPDLLGPLDANFLATYTDGILMVVAVRETKRSAVNKVIKQLEKYHLPILGIIANHPQKAKSLEIPETIQIGDREISWKLPELGRVTQDSSTLSIDS
ncbi:MAG: polysaccharide biosynthesis tyrosine autokinase [Cyanobacteria bacterium]|nr:polysaccharide biosynthesis tyrosine autokinase [Cyanobacteriota bacterium]MDW8199630.1 polysaccharide biosynthesis tyrosine autokinase [Cyanobacteriota bacterium SKYGB_h_bin112]